jgi:chloride channel protein, CIC family
LTRAKRRASRREETAHSPDRDGSIDVAGEAASARERWRESVLSWSAWQRHAVWFLAASVAGAGALYFNLAERYGERFRAVVLAESPYAAAAIVAVGLVVICQLRDRVFPGTEGTGIPQVIAALRIPDGPARQRVLSARILVGKLLLLTLGHFGGMTIGREGPSVHVGACALYLSSGWARFPRHLLERGLILAGGAAGIAAAFNAPVAGILFAFEEIGRSFEKENASTIVRTAIWASLVCTAAVGWYFFYGRLEVSIQSPPEWAAVPVIGVVLGLLGGSYARALLAAVRRLRPLYREHPIWVAGGLGIALAALGLLSGGLTYGSGYAEAERILVRGEDLPTTFGPLLAAANFVSLLSGIPGGLFDPTLTTGSALGQIALPLSPFAERQAFLLLCMGAYFTGVVQAPVTASAILLEMTGAAHLTLPLLLATVLAYEASRLVCPTSLYEGLAQGFLDAIGSSESPATGGSMPRGGASGSA